MDPRIKKELKAKGQALESTIRLGKEGISPGLENEISAQLRARKLVKMKLVGKYEREEREKIANELARNINCELVEIRGNTILLARVK